MNTLQKKEFYSVIMGGSFLAFNAGLTNAVAVAGIFGTTVSHVTGTVTRLGIEFGKLDFGPITTRLSLLFCFGFGSFICALLIGDQRFKLGRSYGVVLALESFLFFLTYVLVHMEVEGGQFIITMACGVQNAMASTYSGAVLRTTHMTGILTDIGVLLAAAVSSKGQSPDLWKLKVFLPLLLFFTLGATAGQLAWKYGGRHALLLPCALIGALGVWYWSSDIVASARQLLKEAEQETKRKRNNLANQKAKAMAFISKHLKKLSSPNSPSLLEETRQATTDSSTVVGAQAKPSATPVTAPTKLEAAVPSPPNPTFSIDEEDADIEIVVKSPSASSKESKQSSSNSFVAVDLPVPTTPTAL